MREPTTRTDDTVPRAKVAKIAALYNELLENKKKQGALQAELIRWCVMALRMDPKTAKIRGHENWNERAKIIQGNQADQKLALIYLDWVATCLERGGIPEGELPLPTGQVT